MTAEAPKEPAAIGSSKLTLGLTVVATSAASSAGVTVLTRGARVSPGGVPEKFASTQ